MSFLGVASPRDLPDPFKEEFEFCVPDVGETGEVWSLSPVKVEYMGVYDAQTKHIIIIIAEPDETSQKAAKLRHAASELARIARELTKP